MLVVMPFLNNNSFFSNVMAQEYDNNYYADNNSYSKYPTEDKKYKCRTGSLEGFFVSSVEICMFNQYNNDNKDVNRDNNENNSYNYDKIQQKLLVKKNWFMCNNLNSTTNTNSSVTANCLDVSNNTINFNSPQSGQYFKCDNEQDCPFVNDAGLNILVEEQPFNFSY